jgi:hypothetical protein
MTDGSWIGTSRVAYLSAPRRTHGGYLVSQFVALNSLVDAAQNVSVSGANGVVCTTWLPPWGAIHTPLSTCRLRN